MFQNQNKATLQLRLSDFQGPLDVLLTLIRNKKIEIHNINIAELADQFIEFLNNSINDIQIDEFGEYLYMVSVLARLKAKNFFNSLNSNNEPTQNSQNEINTKEELIKQLIEFDKFKNSIEFLNESYINRQQMFAKEKDNFDIQINNSIEFEHQSKELKQVFEKLLKNTDLMQKIDSLKQNKNVFKQNTNFSKVSISQVQESFVEFIKQNNKIKLLDYFLQNLDKDFSKEYFCTLFLVILVLIKKEIIKIIEIDNEYYIELISDLNFKIEIDESEY